MKKFTIFMAAIASAFALTACGETAEYTEYEQEKIEYAEYLAINTDLPTLGAIMDGSLDSYEIPWSEFTMDEVGYYAENVLGISADGYGFYNAITSFTSTGAEVGAITKIGEASSVIDDEQIIVNVEVTCENGVCNAELIYSNDMFLTLKSASLNQNFTMKEKMGKAGLNTVIGIGTVFCVLVLICLLISLFGFIPKIQKAIADKKAAKAAEENAAKAGIDNAVNQIIANETAADESDDAELVAVIAAAIAAYEGSAGADGYVVRSIKRRR